MTARILVVEDEGIIARDLQHTLQRFGYDVPETAATAEEALDAAARLKPDLVLMDIHLAGGTDGSEAAAAIQAEGPVAIVYLTAYADKQTMEKAQAAKPYGYLVKPYEEETLRTTVETALRRAAEVQEREQRLHVVLGAMDQITDALLLVDEDGKVMHANDAAARMFDGGTGKRMAELASHGAGPAWPVLHREPKRPHPVRLAGMDVSATAMPIPTSQAYLVVVVPASGDPAEVSKRAIAMFQQRVDELL